MRKYSCSHITPSTCVPYEGDLPEWSKHKDSDECVMISDVIEEIYDELTRIREAIDVRDLGESCVKVSGDAFFHKCPFILNAFLCRHPCRIRKIKRK